MGRLHVSYSSTSSLAEYYVATPVDHGFPFLVWGGWVLVFYIGGVAELDRLAASLLGSVAESISWALSLLLKIFLSCPLVMDRGWDVDGGWNTRYWLVRRVVRDLWHILCYLKMGLVVYYLQLIEAVLQILKLSLCCALGVTNKQFCNGRFVHCDFYVIEFRPISFLA